MGAEQSALLASTETKASAPALPMPNAELFFHSMHFDSMPKQQTGPVTDALSYLVDSMQYNKQNKCEETLLTPVLNSKELPSGSDLDVPHTNNDASCCCTGSSSAGCSSVSVVKKNT